MFSRWRMAFFLEKAVQCRYGMLTLDDGQVRRWSLPVLILPSLLAVSYRSIFSFSVDVSLSIRPGFCTWKAEIFHYPFATRMEFSFVIRLRCKHEAH